MWLNCFSHIMVFEIILNNDIQIFFISNSFFFLKEKNIFVYIIEKNLTLNFHIVIWTKS
jgi:hypothetical protein